MAAIGPAGETRWTVDLGVGIRTVAATGNALFVSTTDDALVALGG